MECYVGDAWLRYDVDSCRQRYKCYPKRQCSQDDAQGTECSPEAGIRPYSELWRDASEAFERSQKLVCKKKITEIIDRFQVRIEQFSVIFMKETEYTALQASSFKGLESLEFRNSNGRIGANIKQW